MSYHPKYLEFFDKKVPTDLEDEMTKLFEKLPKPVRLSVYSGEFDSSMFRIFFSEVISKNGHLNDSICFMSKINLDMVKFHKICIVKNEQIDKIDKIPEDLRKISSNIEKYGNFFVIYIGDEYIEKLEEEENKIVPYEYYKTVFPFCKTFDKLKMTLIGTYSVTPYKWNKKIVEVILREYNKDLTICDATSCVGGDTIGFAMAFKKVLSIEKDKLNYEVLCNNINVYNLKNVDVIHGDFFDKKEKICQEADIIFFDPPWKGKDYILENSIELFLNDINIKNLIQDIMDHSNVKMCVLKVPKNYNCKDIAYFYKLELKKFNVLYIKKIEKESYIPVSSDKQVYTLYNSLYKKNLIQLFQRHLKHYYTKDINIEEQLDKIFENSKSDRDCYIHLRKLIDKVQEENENRGKYRLNDLSKFIDLLKYKETRYLDIGGGDGKITYDIGKEMKLKKEDIVSLDVDEWFDTERSKVSDVTYSLTDGKTIDFEDESFDLITCFQSLHHIDNLDLMIKEIFRVMKKGGNLIIREHDCEQDNNLLKMLIDIEHSIFELVIKDYNIEFVEKYKAFYKSKKDWTRILSPLKYIEANYPVKSKFNNPTRFYYAMYQK